ncbi:DJ-1/PfpI family protein [Sneathiella glossodoripedis]|uniref:DJ-1/PfpI family protein n=1 Tax=Sneathiella glossodoripedis TaxID=418853 RepID=UPI0004712244|nr:DJ-1/PfpI family protein [Sneathiella glossodoripedis]
MQLENTLNGKKIAILVANGFEESHMTDLHKTLVETGAEVKIVSPEKGVVNSWHNNGWGHFFPANAHLPTSMSHHFDAVIIPGGSRHVQRLASDPQTARFMRGFMEDNKPVALFEEAVKVIAVDDLLEHRSVVAVEGIAEDVKAKDADIVEGELNVDDMLVTGSNNILAVVEKFVSCIQSYEPEAWEAA